MAESLPGFPKQEAGDGMNSLLMPLGDYGAAMDMQSFLDAGIDAGSLGATSPMDLLSMPQMDPTGLAGGNLQLPGGGLRLGGGMGFANQAGPRGFPPAATWSPNLNVAPGAVGDDPGLLGQGMVGQPASPSVLAGIRDLQLDPAMNRPQEASSSRRGSTSRGRRRAISAGASTAVKPNSIARSGRAQSVGRRNRSSSAYASMQHVRPSRETLAG